MTGPLRTERAGAIFIEDQKVPRYPHLDKLTKQDLKRIARLRDNDRYRTEGGYSTFEEYCLCEWQRSANTINRRLKRAGFTSKRTTTIEKKNSSAEWIKAKFKALHPETMHESRLNVSPSVSPSMSPKSEGVSPFPSINNSRKQEEPTEKKIERQIDSDKLTNIDTESLGTQKYNGAETSTKANASSSGSRKTAAELEAERFEALFED